MAKKTRRGFMKSASAAMAGAGFFASWGTGCAYLKSNKTRKMPSPSSMSPIPQRILGRTKLPVTLLGFGVGPIIDSAVYRRAYELGIRYYHISFDKHSTKLPPGEKVNKEALTALRPFREQSVISYMTTVRSNKQELLEDLDEFLRLSGFGHIDVWFVCCPSPGLINEFGEALILARRAGKARWGALSTHSLHKTIPLLLVPDSPIDVVMLGYNHTSSADDNEYLIKLHDASLGITPMKPLAGRFFQKTSKDPSPLLRWLAMEERIHTIPVGMKTVAQVEQNVAALQKPFSDEDHDELKAQLAYTSARFCRMCGACNDHCTQGLAVSELVRAAMYAEGYGEMSVARSHFNAIAAPQRHMSCRDCAYCTVACPNGVAFQDRIVRAIDLLS